MARKKRIYELRALRRFFYLGKIREPGELYRAVDRRHADTQIHLGLAEYVRSKRNPQTQQPSHDGGGAPPTA